MRTATSFTVAVSGAAGIREMSVNFSFVAGVISSNSPHIQVGDSVVGSVSYDNTQVGNGGAFTFTGSSKVHTFGFHVNRNGSQVWADAFQGQTSSFFQMVLLYNTQYGGQTGTQLQVKGVTNNSGMFDLLLWDLNNVGFSNNNALPNATQINDFALTSATCTFT
jgi:hypothetical protein